MDTIPNYTARKKACLGLLEELVADRERLSEELEITSSSIEYLWERLDTLEKEAAGKNPNTFEDDHDPNSGDTLYDLMPELSPEVPQ